MRLLRPPSGMKGVNLLLGAWTVLVLAFLWLPIVVLIVYSFNDAQHGIAWKGFTLKWYEQLVRVDRWRLLGPLRNSLVVAAVTTVASTVLGTLGAWLMHRYRYRFARSIDALVLTPMIVPEVIMGVSLLIFFKAAGVTDGMTRIILAHITFCFPFVLVAVRARLAGIDPSLEEAAIDLGATPARAFILVIVPYLLPAIIAGALLAFTLSMDELVVTWFTYDAASRTLPIRVFELARVGLKPELNAMSALFIAFTVVLVVAAERLRIRQTLHTQENKP